VKCISLTLLCAAHLFSSAPGGAAGRDTLSCGNGTIRVDAVRERDGYTEEWFARGEDGWHMVARSGSESRGGLVLGTPPGPAPVRLTGARLVSRGKTAGLELRGEAGTARFVETIRIPPGSRCASVTVAMTTPRELRVSELLSTYAFAPDGKETRDYGSPDFVFTPQLRPAPDDVIADHVFRSPAFILQSGSIALAIVPDVRTIDGRMRPVRSGGDLQVAADRRPFVSFGLMNWKRRKEHVYYVHADTMLSRFGPGTLSYSFFLYANSAAPVRGAYRDLVRFEWSEFGHHNFLNPVSPQSHPFADYIHRAWYGYVPAIALDTTYRGVPVTLLRQGRLAWSNHLPPAADNDCWFNVWFNALRTAYGMHLYGSAAGDTALVRRSERVLNLALLAPRSGGLAPTIFYVDSSGGHWVADQAWGGIDGGRRLPMFHNAWTATWMLSWADILPARRGEILDFTSGIARFLIAHQEASGVIPSWYDAASGEPSPVLRDENAETAGGALFLSLYASAAGDSSARRAAENAMRFIFASVVPARKWHDFETFFSCSAKPVGFFDSVTGQSPQNTLSMWAAAEACASLYSLTGNRDYIDRGAAILDYLCFYQQVWSPRWLSRELFGGFGVQNTDAEWSDSRQGYFAVTLMEYYALTGSQEYFERGVAALRAMFSLFESPGSPRTAENYGHSGEDDPAGVTGIHWGTGSSVVSIHIITARYGDAYVNVRDGWGAGIDGCRVQSVQVAGHTIRFSLLDNVGDHRTVRVKFGNTGTRRMSVVVNGRRVGRFTQADLERGIDVSI
jgi:hypothetical protein